MVVVLIIGVLAAIAIPVFLNLQKEGIKASVKSDVKNTVTSVAAALASDSTATIATPNHSVPTAIGSTAATTVVTPGSRVAVLGDWQRYVVNGFSASAGNFTYHFDSSTGSYQTGAGSVTP